MLDAQTDWPLPALPFALHASSAAPQATDLKFRQAPTIADCFPMSEKLYKEVPYGSGASATTLQVRVGPVRRLP